MNNKLKLSKEIKKFLDKKNELKFNIKNKGYTLSKIKIELKKLNQLKKRRRKKGIKKIKI